MQIKNRTLKNATWIIACRIIQSLLGLVISMLTARYLGPSNFGVINYAASIVAFVAPIMSLGLSAIIVQEVVQHPEREGETLGSALMMTLLSSVFCIFGVVAFVFIADAGDTETITVCTLYSLLLVFQAIEMIQYWFQAKLLSKYTSIVSLIAYVVVSAYKIFLLVTEKSIHWFAVSNAFDYLIIGFSLLIIYKKVGTQKLSFSKSTAKLLLSKGKHFIIANMMVTIFAQTDRIMLKLMIDSTATGYYSAAASCAAMTSFVFAAIIDSARPTIIDSKNNTSLYELNIKRMYSVVIYFALAQSVIIAIFAKPIITLLYGAEYLPAVSALSVVVWYSTFSYLGAARNVWILAEERQDLLWIINLCGALMNVVLNFFLIPVWDIVGAAVASLITQIFTNVVLGFIIKPLVPNNRLMIESLNPKYLIQMTKSIFVSIFKEKKHEI